MKLIMRMLLIVIPLCLPVTSHTNMPTMVLSKQVQTWQTKSGIKTLFLPRHEIPMVDVALTFDAGSSRDGKHWGLANLTSSLFLESTQQHEKDALMVAIEMSGAAYQANASKDDATIMMRSLSEKKTLNESAKLFNEILTKPAFQKPDLTRMKEKVTIGLEYAMQDPSYYAFRELSKQLFGNHPYAHPSNGTIESIKPITSKMVKQFYQKYYVAKNATMAIVGDLSLSDAKALSESITANLPKGQKPQPTPKVVKPKLTQKVFHIPYPSTQTSILIGQIGIDKKDERYKAFMLGNYTFGGAGMTSLLFNKLRDKYGLVYTASSNFVSFKRKGIFAISALTKNETAEKTVSLTQKLLKEYLTSGPTKLDLNSAKQYYIESFPGIFAENSSLIGILAEVGYYQIPLEQIDNYIKEIRTINTKKVTQILNEIIHLDDLVVVTVGSKAKN